jgi:hypothetical protein
MKGLWLPDDTTHRPPMSNRFDNPRVFFCMPAFKGSNSSSTTVTLFVMVNLLRDIDIQSTFVTIDGSEIVMARNTLATRFMEDPNWTHLFFIDDDMIFAPELIIDMLRTDKPLIGAVAPKRRLWLDKFHAAAVAGASLEQATAEASEFVIRHRQADQFAVVEGVAQVAAVGMATTLIRRDVFETMLAKGAAEERVLHHADGRKERLIGFFDLMHDQAGQYLSEDFSFCHRWTQHCDGEVSIIVDRRIGHIGPFTFEANYMEILKQGRLV